MFFQKGIDIYLVYGSDEEASAFFNKLIPGSNFKMDVDCAGSWCYSGKLDIPVYMLRVSPTKDINYRTIVHESVHMMQHICEYEMIRDDEFPALFTGWIAEEFIDFIFAITNKQISCKHK